MQALRNAALLTRFVLVWFVLGIGVAIASPVVKPQAIELVCSGGALKVLAQGDDAGQPGTTPTLDCPLCALAAPPPALQGTAKATAPQGIFAPAIPSTRIAAITAAPLPARGPPLSAIQG